MKMLATIIAIASVGCVSTETIVTSPDGTITRTTIKGVDSSSVAAGVAIASSLAPTVISEK